MFFNFKSYNELISHARSEYRYKGDGTYYELHHIVPRHCGGTNDKEAFQIKNELLDNYLSNRYKLGRVDKIEKVVQILTPEEKFKILSERQLKISEKKKETWRKKGWSIEDSKKWF